MKRIIFLIIFLIPLALVAETAEELFTRGNDQYNAGDYSDAINTYEKIISRGESSAAVYFNLGNAYYKQKQYPEAILNYERAKKLAPADDEIEMNLKIANLKIVDKIKPIPEIFIIEWLKVIRNQFSASGWSIAIVVASWLFFISLGAYFWLSGAGSRRIAFLASAATLLLLVIALSFGFSRYSYEHNRKEAIVFATNQYVTSSPGVDSTELFVLHEGAKVEILDHVEGWKKIRLADGKEGWLPEQSVEII